MMKARLTILLVLIVCLPLAAVIWLGARMASEQQEVVQQRFRGVLSEQLRETDRTLVRYFTRLSRELSQQANGWNLDIESLREATRHQPSIRQIFVVDKQGSLVFPPDDDSLSHNEIAFQERAAQFLQDKDLLRAAIGIAQGASKQPDRSVRSETVSEQAGPNGATEGWHVWYYGRGLELIYWQRHSDTYIVGIELDRSRWLSELIAELPASASAKPTGVSQSLIRLVDSNGKTVYQWGDYEPQPNSTPWLDRPASYPLASWRLQYHIDDATISALSGRGQYLTRLAGLAAIAVAVIALGLVFHRESVRELREAATRVNFVNQVSHELKTPLTNIRLYADLLEHDLIAVETPVANQAKQRLNVILTETQRLSRLINNVLTFSRQQRGSCQLRGQLMVVDQAIEAALLQFAPLMRQKGFEVRTRLNAPTPIRGDADAVEQILANLLTNAEKYAAEGGPLEITSSQTENSVEVQISDRGPGIPTNQRDRVFQPFFRLSNGLESAAGTGIGLTIARNLARLHGGDLRIMDTDQGARFLLELRPLNEPIGPDAT